jgi:hypothetical protein
MSYFGHYIMNAIQRWALCALLLGVASPALAQDELVLGSPLPASPGDVVQVPVYLRDVAGTLLGAGGQAPIQWIDLSITHSHPQFIVGCLGTTYPNCDLQFRAAGELARPSDNSGTLINVSSLYVRRIFGTPLSFTGGLDLIGLITFRLVPDAPAGTVIQLQFEPTDTFLANHDRSVVEKAGSIVDGGLKLTGTSVNVCPTGPPGPPSFDFSGPFSQCSSASSICRAGEHVEFATEIPIDVCDTVTWSFGDGTLESTNASRVSHQFTLPNFQTFATYTVSATVIRASGSAVFSRQVSIEPGCTVTVPETAVAGTSVVFTADTFPPSFGSFVSFPLQPTLVSWKFGDGTAGLGTPIEHTYQFGGAYLWEARVSVFGLEGPCIVRLPIQVLGPLPPRRRAVRE